ncbi:hypothetical protein [Krasilnikovia sp. MM14-A1004]|uniref:hypothetical protein n=1 Tax=Krasilnikovia sp. MM14-A1004 TaxID=3373541 RepID=UPI00399D39CB
MSHRRGRYGRGSAARPDRARRGLVRQPLIVVGAALGVAATGGVAAFAGWSVTVQPASFTVYAARIPQPDPPRARAHLLPWIAWQPVTRGAPVDRYVVTRHLGPAAQVACEVSAAARPRCTDRQAPPGYRATYTVAAAYGSHWVGVDSGPSAPVTVPGVAVPITVNGIQLRPGPDGTPVVVSGAEPSAYPSLVSSTTANPAAPPADRAPSPSGPAATAPPVSETSASPAVRSTGEPASGDGPGPDPGSATAPTTAPAAPAACGSGSHCSGSPSAPPSAGPPPPASD